ncbi:hypothetical protein [Cohnella soli]|uniref:Alpha-galactosidase n=1 Tax=Cohnella soli TaxID=425005 RepID=A0ABW0HX45_9BACL
MSGSSGDAYIVYDAESSLWTLGTETVERKIRLTDNGQLLTTSYRNKRTNREYVQGDALPDEFRIEANAVAYTGASTGWTYRSHAVSTLSQGELQLALTIGNAVLDVTRYYVVFPFTGAMKEWSVFRNRSGREQRYSAPSMFRFRLMHADIADFDMQYMTGGGHFTGSGILKTVPLTPAYVRTFDSYDKPEVIEVDGACRNETGSYEQGTSVYDAFFTLRNRKLEEGIWLSFDYNGHWLSTIEADVAGVQLNGSISMTEKPIAPEASLTSPVSIIGVFSGDLDDMGNTILDYTYRYLWDYTRFNGCMGGTWQWRVSPQMPFAFESVNYNRYIGGKTVHIDADWYGHRGDWKAAWEGDDFEELNRYVKKSGMMMKVWSPFWHADYGSDVIERHSDYLVGDATVGFYGLSLNLANEEAYQWMLGKANELQREWGPYQWRYDGFAANRSGGSDNDMLQQSHNFFRLLRAFKEANPEAWIEGCSSGGEILSMEAVRYSDTQQLTDGNAKHYAGYYQSLKLPLDKLIHAFQTEPGMDRATRFNALQPEELELKERIRRYHDLHRYLTEQGLYGRWVKVYRPAVSEPHDATYVLQKTNRDHSRAMIMFNSYAPFYDQQVKVYPKGLLDDMQYTVSCPRSGYRSPAETGAHWKLNGVALPNLQAGELVLFNVPHYPGSGYDSEAPSAPGSPTMQEAVYMGRFGIELNWSEATDNHWLSYYEIERNGVATDKVSRGTFYFCEGAGIVDVFQVRAVDGDGNASAYVRAAPLPGDPVKPAAAPDMPSRYEASVDFSAGQGRNNWAYLQQYAPMTAYPDWSNMAWDANSRCWQGVGSQAKIGADWMQPGENYHAVRKWVAPCDGVVSVAGTVLLQHGGKEGGAIVRIKRSGEYPYLDENIWGPVALRADDSASAEHAMELDMKHGDCLYFIAGKSDHEHTDKVIWNPQVTIVNKRKGENHGE